MPHHNHLPDFAACRQAMVARQLAGRDIRDPRVLATLGAVPREAFVPPDLQCEAYADRPLPIGEGQTISQPYTVAFMAQALALAAGDRVLEIGTGSGYGAAVLSRLAREVYTVERLPALAEAAHRVLREQGCGNVQVRTGDGALGWPEAAPFDAICVTAAAAEFPQALAAQLAEGGRLVVPLGPAGDIQMMRRYTRRGNTLSVDDLGEFAFVPLITGE